MGATNVLSTTTSNPVLAIVSGIAVLLIYFARVRYSSRLRLIPGPFLASISHIPRLLSVAHGHAHFDAINLHRKYGSVVRVGPNHVAFSDPEALSIVYSAYFRFEKSDFYLPFDAKTAHGFVPTVFSVRSEHAHRGIKRPIASAYSMTALLELEGLTDECIAIFQNKVEDKLDSSEHGSIEMNLGDWLHWYAFDLITSITFSNRLGFMESETDVEGIIAAIEGRLKYNATIGQWPALHKFLLGNNLVSWLANFVPSIVKMNTAGKIVQFAARQLKRYETKDPEKSDFRDMLERFKRTKINGEIQMTDVDVLMGAVGNIFAGSDTTAISLRSMFYYLINDPNCMRRLVEEVDEMNRAGKLSKIVTFAESSDMPYLQACLKEAMRMHPAVGLLLERIVPEGGVTIDGHYIPAGSVVGANPWAVARDRNVYGEDADQFRPERWLDASSRVGMDGAAGESARTKLKDMERNFLAFGMGSRSCLGKNISLLEMNKLVPQMLRSYEFRLADPNREWDMEDYWFVKQLGLNCRISRRQT
ncbi:hypothetical protein PMZ80_000604 [Knufia obscura]|uniref:Cytochrome P450 n=1 Tax=Knufia obscura TaxID=1635080 RepID=A0ABR0S0X0_9EURO|nr:hypothetical protein PMZ80_000604 [Knufia obscura]